MNPNQFSSYVGVKLLLPAKGRLAMVPQGSAAARKPVQMSFLGVGAPEALLVAIVALVVFGPKGLADAARSLGTALRSFQPTIKEVVQVSQELKGTLEKELGIDELRDAARPVGKPLDLSNATMSDPLARVVDPDIEAKRAASAQMAWGATPEAPAAASPSPAPAAAEAPKPAAAPAAAAAPLKDLAAMSVEELEAEINRRRAAAGGEKRV
ncbi:hypothetical protein HYH03_015891 [Edaphochlamys debaryana]|uniref:Uncharacterized protein n=1 Tax=Edaphochlamys debaryana TaxID=47281 RepID=A0A835XR01_9CHLO|nr:hypothetical protein HYH03_015891 [Edaphochlamys debaryana]|eukprot:KAG2485405.1 hypothetical protein HYH03_015891 [Edaphochlamys debaryana]